MNLNAHTYVHSKAYGHVGIEPTTTMPSLMRFTHTRYVRAYSHTQVCIHTESETRTQSVVAHQILAVDRPINGRDGGLVALYVCVFVCMYVCV